MKSRVITYLYLAVLGVVGYFLFAIKSEVQNLNFQISAYKKQIASEKSNLNILKAEFAYLTSPQRLSQLVSKHLKLTSIKAGQAISDPLDTTIEEKQGYKQPLMKNIDKVRSGSSIKWRYKYAHQKSNVQKASYRR